jgi:peroxiredoxin Q/BCP
MRTEWILSLAALFVGMNVVSMVSTLRGDEPEKVELKVGDEAPEFTATDDTGEEWKSEDHVGKKVIVVYFYPADFTLGCTAQACGFRDDMTDLSDKDVEVVGVSGDSAENHKLFKEHHKLNFTLLADEEGKLAKSFGVPMRDGGEVTVKELDGKVISRGVTTARWTFVIDKDGKIAYKNEKVVAKDDSKEILKLIKKLGS